MPLPSTEINEKKKQTLFPDDIDYQLLFRHLYKKELRQIPHQQHTIALNVSKSQSVRKQ